MLEESKSCRVKKAPGSKLLMWCSCSRCFSAHVWWFVGGEGGGGGGGFEVVPVVVVEWVRVRKGRRRRRRGVDLSIVLRYYGDCWW